MISARRSRAAALLAALGLVPLAASGQTAVGPHREASPHRDLDLFGAALDRAVRQVSRPAALVGATGPVRAYALPEVGVIFVLSPRALPTRRTASLGDRQAARALAEAAASLQRSLRQVRPEMRPQIERSLEAVRRAQEELRRRLEARRGSADLLEPGAPALAFDLPPSAELAAEARKRLLEHDALVREFERSGQQFREQHEEQIKAMRDAAEALRGEAERAQREAERELRNWLPPSVALEPPDEPDVPEALELPEGSAPDVGAAPAAPSVAAPPAPAAPGRAPAAAGPGHPSEPATPAAPARPGVPGTPSAPGVAPAPPAAPAWPSPVLVPTPPWHTWLDLDEGPQASDPETVIGNVRAAVLRVLENEGARLTEVRPDESVVVAVDFVPRALRLGSRPTERTLVVRVRKKDIDERKAGRLDAGEFRRRARISER